MRSFKIPIHYRSPIISKVKAWRKAADPRKQDFAPSVLNFGSVEIILARHFGFCFGVENAIEISYKALEENPGKRIYLLSQMIHNQEVNRDLESRGIQFLMDTMGNEILPFEVLRPEDIVIVPAFGTTLELEAKIRSLGIEVARYDTTCPFVEKVWKRSKKLGSDAYTVIIHGKPSHEETRATFSHSAEGAHSLVVKNMEETRKLGDMILGTRPRIEFDELFKGRASESFDFDRDLEKIGVVNQTTMLASDTQAIADHLKEVMMQKYGDADIRSHFADTRDTLCYATNDNQTATKKMLEESADLALVIGGYNSSNTSHLVDLCEEKVPSYFINSEEEIESAETIHCFDLHQKKRVERTNWLPHKSGLRIIVSSGASCPDVIVERVIHKVLSFFPDTYGTEKALDISGIGTPDA